MFSGVSEAVSHSSIEILFLIISKIQRFLNLFSKSGLSWQFQPIRIPIKMWALFKPDLNRLKATRFEFLFSFCKISGYELNRARSRSVIHNGVIFFDLMLCFNFGPKRCRIIRGRQRGQQ